MKIKNKEWFYYLLMGIVLVMGLVSSWYLYNLGNHESASGQQVSELKTEQLAEAIKQEELLFVYFYTPDCSQCKKNEKMVVSSATESRQKWVKANVKFNPDFNETYKIKSTPTLIVFKGGKEVSRLETDWDEEKVNAIFQGYQ
ncbi:thioredoxin family protein [Metabacillus herbersteinensis]|uniref:Thioredoxin family protein n=1 Tax=Metabacillus herbersteinensis TaxID=283816 RepID=A0ABV6GMJ8_9BACI